jgi:hypothetical protein
MRLKLPNWLRLYGPAAMIALLPTLTSWIGNRFEVSAAALLVPVIVALLTALVVTLAFLRLWRRDRLAAIAGVALATLVLANNFDGRLTSVYPLFQAFTPFSSLSGLEGTLFAAAFAIIVIVLARLAGLGVSALVRRRKWNARDAYMAIVIAAGATFAFQVLTVVSDMAGEWAQFAYRPAKITASSNGSEPAGKPDIYYIVLEDYANQNILKKDFDFENTEFTNFLKDRGYYINPSAHNNYPYTTMSVASTLSADYLNDLLGKFKGSHPQTVIPFHETVRSAPVAQLLQSIGYKYLLVGSWYETTNLSRVADTSYTQEGLLRVFGHTFVLDNFPKLMMMGSMFGRFMGMGIQIGNFHILGYQNLGDIDLDKYALNSLKDLTKAPAGGRFIFAHIILPHEPNYFNADGSLNTNTGRDNVGEPVRVKYVNQIKYINGQMETVLGQIDESSHGKAIVVLQSDEGPRPLGFDEDTTPETEENEIQAGDMRNWSDRDIETKYGLMAAFKLPGVDVAAHSEGATTVNIFRLVLNSYFGYSLPYRPECVYAYPDGRNRPLMFASITERITGRPEDPRCNDDGTVKP